MKQLLFFCLLILLSGFSAGTADPIHITWYVVLLLIIGLYEVVVRIIPAVARFSLLALIIDILKLVSDYLKRKKK